MVMEPLRGQDESLNQWAEAVAVGEWIDYNHNGLLDYYIKRFVVFW